MERLARGFGITCARLLAFALGLRELWDNEAGPIIQDMDVLTTSRIA